MSLAVICLKEQQNSHSPKVKGRICEEKIKYLENRGLMRPEVVFKRTNEMDSLMARLRGERQKSAR